MIKVFKFGGASLKNAEAIKNARTILKKFSTENIIVVVSAMGKTTNAFEKLTDACFNKRELSISILNEIKKYHFDIADELFSNKNNPIFNELSNTFVELNWVIEDLALLPYNQQYDQIVS